MPFESILYDAVAQPIISGTVPPPCLSDLNLDQVFSEMARGRELYDLMPIFYELPQRLETALYRQRVMQDVAKCDVCDAVKLFSDNMRSLRGQITRAVKLFCQRQKERVYLDAVAYYCEAIITFEAFLSRAAVASEGFLAFRYHLATYVAGDAFITMHKELRELSAQLSDIEYQLFIHDGRITVSPPNAKSDYNTDIERTFGRFSQDASTEYAFTFHDYPEMNHIEAGILDLIAKIYPEVFSHVASCYLAYQDFVDPAINRWDREIQFYLSYLQYIDPLAKCGLHFCYPILSTASKAVRSEAGFDIALAHKLMHENTAVVANDFYLDGDERIFVVTGPNQGGKTTFARMFGQMHYLARLGYPVPGAQATLFFFDNLFTHFEREEDILTLRGKLEDELVRSRQIVTEATPRSIVILNEVFTSTTLDDALFLARRLLEMLIALDLLCVCVTFIDELSSLGPATVSLVSCLASNNPSQRTFRLARKVADGRSYAASIADRYGLSYKTLKKRLSP